MSLLSLIAQQFQQLDRPELNGNELNRSYADCARAMGSFVSR